MDWGLVQTILNVVLGITAVAFSIVAIRGAKRKRPVWCYRTRHIIGREAEAPPELKLMFGSKEVGDLYKTTIVFLNMGNDIINRSDTAEKITIHFGDAEILKEPVVRATREKIGFSAKQVDNDEKNVVQLDFEWLGRHDGAVMEVWHNNSTSVTCSGEFKNVRMTQLKEPVMARPQDFRANIFAAAASLAFIGLIWRDVILDITTPGVDWTLGGGAIILTIMVGMLIAKIFPRLFRYMTYPSWARFRD